jgi:hypothetical protein
MFSLAMLSIDNEPLLFWRHRQRLKWRNISGNGRLNSSESDLLLVPLSALGLDDYRSTVCSRLLQSCLFAALSGGCGLNPGGTSALEDVRGSRYSTSPSDPELIAL